MLSVHMQSERLNSTVSFCKSFSYFISEQHQISCLIPIIIEILLGNGLFYHRFRNMASYVRLQLLKICGLAQTFETVSTFSEELALQPFSLNVSKYGKIWSEYQLLNNSGEVIG